jgi:predicted GIY-YIG superfamily endonuclease
MTEMAATKTYWVYILTNDRCTVLYTGLTNDLDARVAKHAAGEGSRFTKRYNVHRLVWSMWFDRIDDAIACEKRIKGWTRTRKLALIESVNPKWREPRE